MNNKTMKKWFSMFALFLLAGFSSASAQQLALDDALIKAGESAELTVKLVSGASNTVYGFQTDIVLPEGLTMEVAPKAVAASMADGSDAAFSVNQQADGAYRIAAFSLGGVAFKAETAVATFTLKAADDFSNVNGKYVGVSLKNTKFTVDANGTEVNAAQTSNVVDAGLFTYPVRPVTIGFENNAEELVVITGILSGLLDSVLGDKFGYREYYSLNRGWLFEKEDMEFFEKISPENIINTGLSNPVEHIFTFSSSYGQISVKVSACAMKSPESDEIYLKLQAENVTDSVRTCVNRSFPYDEGEYARTQICDGDTTVNPRYQAKLDSIREEVGKAIKDCKTPDVPADSTKAPADSLL